MMAIQVAGLFGSVALYLGAVWPFSRVQARAIRALPREWRDHPELRDAYEAGVDLRMRSLFVRPSKAALAWTAGLVGTFATLAAADFTLRVELIYAGSLALVATGVGIHGAVAETHEVAEQHELRLPPRRWWGTRSLALCGSWLLVWLGYFGTACFAGGLLATLLL
jgi:hypothetical protein